MTYAVSIVHLSDLHFGKNSRFKGKDETNLGKLFAGDVLKANREKFSSDRPDLIVITGDLTQEASADEFGPALMFFQSMCLELGVSRSRFVFMPGNHDISWNACSNYFNTHPGARQQEYVEEIGREKLALFEKFKNDFYGEDRPDELRLENGRGAVLYNYAESCISIAALNSAEQMTDENNIGKISAIDAVDFSIRTRGSRISKRAG
jgi:predicted MPP superfamily phosphohydrolase